jgi:pyruvate formate lyase activating enzyme
MSGSLPGSLVLGADKTFRKEAMFYEKRPDGTVQCQICPRQCVVGDLGRGYCRVRENVKGAYYSIVYGRVCAYHVDPIEKKPLFHFLPGTTAFSLATVGCNLECKFCQNWEISQEKPENVQASSLSPDDVAAGGLALKSRTIAFTYTEPTVWYEYVLDTARRARSLGLRSVMISAGYMRRDPMLVLAKELDAIKVDLKSFSQDFYDKICNADLKPVLDTIVTVKGSGTWLEIVNLLIPTLNDADKDVDSMSKWVIENLGADVPIHFTRFYPTYKLTNVPPTSVAAVERARQIALGRGLKYVYVGNVPSGHPGESTYCPSCGQVVVERAGYTILAQNLTAGKCSKCGTAIPGVWA